MALAAAMSRAAAAAAIPLGSAASLQAIRGLIPMLSILESSSFCDRTLPAGCRAKHIIPERRAPSVVPEAILRELEQIESFLAGASRLDGRQRSSLPLSAAELPGPLPSHAVEPGLPALEAHVRPAEAVGGTASKWLRKLGRVPGRVHSLPAGQGLPENLNVHFDEVELGKMVRSMGRNGCTARVLQLNLVRPAEIQQQRQGAASSSSSRSDSGSDKNPATATSSRGGAVEPLGVLRVKPTRVHLNAVTQRLEGLDLLYCPVDRVVLVDVPVRLINDDAAPGARKGGWMQLLRRTVRYKALGNVIPPFLEVNVRHLDLDQDLLVRELPILPGTKLYEKDYNAVVVRCTTDMGKD